MNAIGIGTELDGVRLDAIAGRGGSSIVYQATDLSTGELRAVKVLTNPDPGAIRRLRREADLLAQADHPQLAGFYGRYAHGDQVALITAWCPGTTLRERALGRGRGRGRGDIDFARVALRSIAEPLCHLHSHNIVHRDISPSNVMLHADGSFTLIDLGIGHSLGASTLTNNDMLAGTPSYLAPEIVRGESATPRSDQYSLAMMVYEIAAGRAAFPDDVALAATLHHQLHTTPPPLDEIDPQLAGPFADAVHRALSKDPSDRFGSVHEFVAAANGAGFTTQARRSRRAPLAAAAAVLVLLGTAALALAIFDQDAGTGATADLDEVQGLVTTPSEAPLLPDEVGGAGLDAAAGADETGGSDVTSTASRTVEWVDGLAAGLACNQLAGTDFSNGSVPLDYYGDPPGRERVVDQGGVNDSWALEVGVANEFGQFAEIVPVSAGSNYWFRGWFDRQGTIEAAEMGITLLDSAYRSLDLTVTQQIVGDTAGYHEVEFANIPTEAAFALPYLFKDASPGVILADELIFGVTSTCFDELSAGDS